jgi:hypothetical protein
MYHANVLVDNLTALPPAIDYGVHRVLEIESWKDQVTATTVEAQTAAHLTTLGTTF